MAIKTFNLPDPGEGLVEAEIVEWKVAPGDTVKVNDMVLEIETAKSLVELPIPWAGTVKDLLVEVGQTIDVGTPIISIDDGLGGDDAPAAAPSIPGEKAAPAEGASEAILVGYGAKAGATARRARKNSGAGMPSGRSAPPVSPAAAPVAVVTAPVQAAPVVAPAPAQAADGARPKAKPPVRKLAKDLGIDLAAVTPTGPDGVITRDDVNAHVSGSTAPQADSAVAAAPGGTAYRVPFGSGEREERIPIKGVRKMTAQAMVGSAFTAPHVTEWITLDVTKTMELVERLKGTREFKDVKVTPLLVLARALVLAIRRNPGMNATWDEAAQEIVQKNYVNLGIAAATPRGLIVPNIKDAHALTMLELAQAIGQLTATAREGRTQPAEMSGGTITITNVGVFGVDSGTPIINPGESAIVCFGAIRKQPWVVTAVDGSDEIAIRHVTQLAVSFDHRLIDGELGSRFLSDLAAILEDPAQALVWG
ncbi:pyruvate dehydrogenase E2 component (dihydrolipoamide acetyltransferase) [Humibacillus xanthopallidus]|uniref:Dihydrolipoamide acetyltransferase component of pyruvate dehydrogenase complex n=1 Tax=Humibacillus xanthopallidus TaxID=412689 RepID=A0A543PLQ1_9MICO|nr:dihydrolipoamide acetyltransferase family protein [Humibacillus xanthopallidus]TQN45002.1 pyruvate dehydrogenase E2 component (dihydrolipoamide acetyltransferase) [Humibacillus xanthopallidus]